jgi:hypothetical protein
MRLRSGLLAVAAVTLIAGAAGSAAAQALQVDGFRLRRFADPVTAPSTGIEIDPRGGVFIAHGGAQFLNTPVYFVEAGRRRPGVGPERPGAGRPRARSGRGAVRGERRHDDHPHRTGRFTPTRPG